MARAYRLSTERQNGLVTQSATGEFLTFEEVWTWVEAARGETYRPGDSSPTCGGLVPVRQRRVPQQRRPTRRPRSREGMGDNGLSRRGGVTRDGSMACADAMRLGLDGPDRRVLAMCKAEITQPLRMTYRWACLLLAVGPWAGTIR